MKKILFYVLLPLLLALSVLNANNMTIISEDADGSDVVEVLIRGNGGYCSAWMDSLGDVSTTDCIRLSNSKKIKILCTKKKEICKTEKEIYAYLRKKLSSPQENKDTEYQKVRVNTRSGVYVAENSQLVIEKTGDVSLEVGTSRCVGQFKGIVIEKTNNKMHIKSLEQDREAKQCSIRINFSHSYLDVTEENCNYFHGSNCGFDGQYIKKNGQYKKEIQVEYIPKKEDKSIEVADFILDYEDLKKSKVCVKGDIVSIGDETQLLDTNNASTRILIDVSNMSRSLRKEIMQKCTMFSTCSSVVCGSPDDSLLQMYKTLYVSEIK